MPRTHKAYDTSFRQQAVELLLSGGKPQLDVARDLGICVETLRAWQPQPEQKPNVGVAASANTAGGLERENQRLRRELAYARRRREILKKALAICPGQPGLLGDSN